MYPASWTASCQRILDSEVANHLQQPPITMKTLSQVRLKNIRKAWSAVTTVKRPTATAASGKLGSYGTVGRQSAAES